MDRRWAQEVALLTEDINRWIALGEYRIAEFNCEQSLRRIAPQAWYDAVHALSGRVARARNSSAVALKAVT